MVYLYALTITDVAKRGHLALHSLTSQVLDELGFLQELDKVLENSPRNNTLHYHLLVSSGHKVSKDDVMHHPGYNIDIRPVHNASGWHSYIHKTAANEEQVKMINEYENKIQDWIRRSKRGYLFV